MKEGRKALANTSRGSIMPKCRNGWVTCQNCGVLDPAIEMVQVSLNGSTEFHFNYFPKGQDAGVS